MRSMSIIALASGLLLQMAHASQINLTHRYSFNDGTASDSAGSFNGTLVNGAMVSGGNLVLANDGISTESATGQYVSLPGNILRTSNFTLETWFTFNGGNPWQRLIDLGNSIPDETRGTVGDGFIIITLNGLNNPLGQTSINSWGNPTATDFVYGTNSMPIGGEHVLTYIHSTDTQIEELYLDGVMIGSMAATNANPADAVYTNFYLGRSQFAQDPYYNGSFDEIRTYDGAMTSAQVLESYTTGPDIVAVPEPGSACLVAVGGYLLVQFRRKRNKIAAENSAGCRHRKYVEF